MAWQVCVDASLVLKLVLDEADSDKAHARQFNRPTAYDAHYLALAEKAACDLWTADRRLYLAVSDTLSWVKLLNRYEPAA